MTPVLYIGNRRFSSWSLRAWQVLMKSGIPFETQLIPLNDVDTRRAISAVSPGGTVPALHTSEGIIWDSLAIAEWAAEQVPGLWPASRGLRARARAVSSAMHAGFLSIREHCPMDLKRVNTPVPLNTATQAEIAAVQALWHEVRRPGDTFLFGEWSIADAFFTPIAARFHSYGIALHADAQTYCDTLRDDEHYRAWHEAAQSEDFPNPYENPL